MRSGTLSKIDELQKARLSGSTQTRNLYRGRQTGSFQGLRSGGMGNYCFMILDFHFWKMRKVLRACGMTAVLQNEYTWYLSFILNKATRQKKATWEADQLTLLNGEGAPDLEETQENEMWMHLRMFAEASAWCHDIRHEDYFHGPLYSNRGAYNACLLFNDVLFPIVPLT